MQINRFRYGWNVQNFTHTHTHKNVYWTIKKNLSYGKKKTLNENFQTIAEWKQNRRIKGVKRAKLSSPSSFSQNESEQDGISSTIVLIKWIFFFSTILFLKTAAIFITIIVITVIVTMMLIIIIIVNFVNITMNFFSWFFFLFVLEHRTHTQTQLLLSLEHYFFTAFISLSQFYS